MRARAGAGMSAPAHATTMDGFLAYSTEATCFTVFELRGTGQAQAYLDKVVAVVGVQLVADLLHVHANAPPTGLARVAYLRRELFGDPRLGPVARNIIKLWYVGIWYELPPAWIEAYGAGPADKDTMVSGQAYAEGLLWVAIGANPPGAKAPGYGSWAGPPEIPTF